MRKLILIACLLLTPSLAAAESCFLKVSTAVDIALGPFVDQTDGFTAETALTISQADVRLKKNGGAWAQKNQASSCTHEENGNYECSLDATDTNTTGILRIHVNESGALPVFMQCMVLAAVNYDGLVSGTGTGIYADMVSVSGDSTAANNLESALDGTGGVTISANLNGSVASCTGCTTAGGTTVQPTTGVKKATTSYIVDLFIRDSTTNAGKTGLVFNSASLQIYYCRWDQGNAACSQVTVVTATRGAFTSGGFVEKDATNAPGVYEFGIPNAALASGADQVVVYYLGVAGTHPTYKPIELLDNVSKDVYDRVGAPVGASTSADIAGVKTNVDAVKAKTDFIGFTGSLINSAVGSGGITSASFATSSVTASALATDAVTEITAGVWDEAIAGHLTAGTTGAKLNSAASAGDPWTTALPGAYGAGTAGKIVGDNVNATISSRATQTSVDAVQADTDNLQTRVPAALVSGKIDANIGSVTNDAITAAGLAADVGTEIATAIAGTTISELAQATPPATPTVAQAIMSLYMALRNQTQTTNAQINYTNDAGTTIFKCSLADNGTTFTKSECVAGP